MEPGVSEEPVTVFEAIRRDLALVNEIPLYTIPDNAPFTLDQHLAFQRLTDAIPGLIEAAEKPGYATGYADALGWVLDNIGVLDDADRERIEEMRDA